MDWKATYQELDNATLLSLLPLLAERIDRAKRELEHVIGQAANDNEFAENYQVWLDMAAALHEQGRDGADAIDQFLQGLHSHAEFKPKQEQTQRGLFCYLSDLELRRRWITDVEAPRRGLLPSPRDFFQTVPEPAPAS